MRTEGNIIIHKADLSKYPDTEDLFEIKGPAGIYQTYSGVYNFETITKIIDGYKLVRVIVYCNKMHASTIVKIIATMQVRKYRLHIHRVIIKNDRNTERNIILRFWSSSSNFLYRRGVDHRLKKTLHGLKISKY
jgi:hypothetical protein